MSSEGFLKEVQAIGEKFLLKLQRLPKADPVEIVSFSVVLLFIGEFVGGGKGVSEFLSSPMGATTPQAVQVGWWCWLLFSRLCSKAQVNS